MDQRDKARRLLGEFKKNDFVFGLGCFDQIGQLAAQLGRKICVVASGTTGSWGKAFHERALASLARHGVATIGGIIPGARPNSPFEDVFRVADELRSRQPDAVVSLGGGSVIDALKASIVHCALGDQHPTLDDYFGMGRVTALLKAEGRRLLPHLAVQIAAGSAAHLTKYANVTDMSVPQKLLIIDEAVVPQKALFDYELTVTSPRDLTMDGAFDALSHCLEVYEGAAADKLPKLEPICLTGIELAVANIAAACENPSDLAAREGLGLASDLGGNAIMVGGTSGPHLNSFSMVDLLSHGRACALMNPYYLVFFAPAIEDKLRKIGAVYAKIGHLHRNIDGLRGRELGEAVAEAMQSLCRAVGFPTRLTDLPGFTPANIKRILAAAKNPTLESKLKNMPVPMTADMVDEYMGPVLAAATTGDFSLIKNFVGRRP